MANFFAEQYGEDPSESAGANAFESKFGGLVKKATFLLNSLALRMEKIRGANHRKPLVRSLLLGCQDSLQLSRLIKLAVKNQKIWH